MKILVSGIGGFMGRIVAEMVQAAPDMELVGGIDPMSGPQVLIKNGSETVSVPCFASYAEVPEELTAVRPTVIDFSHHSATQALITYAREAGLPLVLATTGQTPEELDLIDQASSRIPLFFAANYSVGVALLCELAKKAAAAMPGAEIEIIEKHHDRKVDAPSGTALALAKAVTEARPELTVHTGRSGIGKREPNEIGIHAIRMGNIVGEHEVIIGTQNQIITLKHEAQSRALFAEGALSAARFLDGKPAGLYNMQSMIAF